MTRIRGLAAAAGADGFGAEQTLRNPPVAMGENAGLLHEISRFLHRFRVFLTALTGFLSSSAGRVQPYLWLQLKIVRRRSQAGRRIVLDCEKTAFGSLHAIKEFGRARPVLTDTKSPSRGHCRKLALLEPLAGDLPPRC